MPKRFYISITLIVLIFIAGCSQQETLQYFPALADGEYDPEIATSNDRNDLERLNNSVFRILNNSFYITYIFNSYDEIQENEINTNELKQIASDIHYGDQSFGGTATLVARSYNKALYLTCAHVVQINDSVHSYFSDDLGFKSENIASISVIQKSITIVVGLPGGENTEILAIDENNDLALLLTTIDNNRIDGIGTMMTMNEATLGDATQLNWGSKIYAFGYPSLTKILTSGLVSSPNDDDYGSFYIDATINPGFSGGPVFAIRDGAPNYEMVGIISTIPSDFKEVVIPKNLKGAITYDANIPYFGDLFIKRMSFVKYGFIKVIPINKVIKFLQQNEKLIKAAGFSLSFLPE